MTLQAKIHRNLILSQFYGLMDGMDMLLEEDSGVAHAALSTMIAELRRRLPSNWDPSTAMDAELKATPLPF